MRVMYLQKDCQLLYKKAKSIVKFEIIGYITKVKLLKNCYLFNYIAELKLLEHHELLNRLKVKY